MLRHGPRTGVLAASIGALIATGGAGVPAFGQDEDETEEAASTSDEAIIVTGTRIRRDDFTATNATVVVTAEDMRNLGVTSVAEMVNQLPANVASTTPETSGDSAFNLGASVANLRGLNTANGSRTLVLVDSSRFVASNSNGTVDMNMIPTALVGRIETVTGGASATYGADAMAGVVNVIIDNNIEGIRVDLSYDTTDEGDGDSVNLSLGTGFEVFDRRGQITLGYDHNVQDAIPDCTTREYCARGMGVLNQIAGAPPGTPGTALPNPPFPNQPQYIITEGMRYTRLPEGVTPLTTSQAVIGTYGQAAAPAPGVTGTPIGTYTFTADGTGIVPYLDNLGTAERSIVAAAGTGNTGVSPWGSGPLQYEGIPLLPETDRDNLFTRFNYDFEGGISLNASLTYSETTSVALQNSPRQTTVATSNCMFPTNAFLQPESGATQQLRDLMAARIMNTASNQATNMGGGGNCRPGPYLGTSSLDNTLPAAQQLYDFPEAGGTSLPAKHFSEQINRRNETTTNTTNFTVGASGDLFEGGSWTWDSRLSLGESERDQLISDWASARRFEMALHSVWDQTANGGQGAAVCAIDSNQPYVAPSGPGPGHVADLAPPGGFQTMGQYWSARWVEYIQRSINGGQDRPENLELAMSYFNNLAGRDGGEAPCAALNPFGLAASPESLAFAFPTIEQHNENTQDALSVSFSGDIGEGVGAGPFRMAAGFDYRENNSYNFANPNAYTARDFTNPLSVTGTINTGFADNWTGVTETQEAFVEFDFPVLRDLVAADSMAFNVAFRKTENTTKRLQGVNEILTSETSRDIESWKASMVWQPVDMMRVRLTRSADTRAPTAEELFQSNSTALSTGAQNELASFFRMNDPTGVATTTDERLDFMYGISDGANSQLGEEVSVTETLGVVFTPTELLSGLSISIDYFETLIRGGIQQISYPDVDDRCGVELLMSDFTIAPADTAYCPNIVFDIPDESQNVPLTQGAVDFWNARGAATPLVVGDPNPFYPYSNIDTVSGTSENAMPYLSRGIDLSVSYNTQLSGGGFISARLLTSRSLEQSVNTASGQNFLFTNTGGPPLNSGIWRDVSGQTGSNGIGSALGTVATYLQYSPTPRISSNAFVTYAKNAFSLTGQIRYIGTGRLNNQQQWVGPGETGFNPTGIYQYAPGLRGTITRGDLPSWTTLNVNLSYDFSASRFSFDRFEQLQTYLNITNIGNRTPDFFSGTSAGGVNATYFNGMGRQYALGVRMQF
jgi:outer membrane receptor protein involved in Fe transport